MPHLSSLLENAGVKYSMLDVSNRIIAAAKSIERIHQLYLFSRYAEGVEANPAFATPRLAIRTQCHRPARSPPSGVTLSLSTRTGSHTRQVKPSRGHFWPSA